MTQGRILKSMVGAIVLASCAPPMAQATDPAGTHLLDELLNPRISTAAKHEQRLTDVPSSVVPSLALTFSRDTISQSGRTFLRPHVGGG